MDFNNIVIQWVQTTSTGTTNSINLTVGYKNNYVCMGVVTGIIPDGHYTVRVDNSNLTELSYCTVDGNSRKCSGVGVNFMAIGY